MNITWDADQYTKEFSFVHQYGQEVLSLLTLDETTTVLDLGCGNGALTKKLSATGARAIGLDDSEELLQIAREHYPELTFIQANAVDFTLAEPVDAVFSNAVFHWIEREQQPGLLHSIYAALKDGGQLVFEFGGHGNNQLIHAALRSVFTARGLDYELPFYFPTIGEYASLLEQAGFQVSYMSRFDRRTALGGPQGLADWIKMFVQKPFAGLKEADKAAIIQEAAVLLQEALLADGVWYADYVRLRGRAVKA